MKQIQRVLVVLFMILGIDSAHEAHAYLDPGSGSMLLQLLMGGIAGAVVVFKLYWQQFIGLFRSSKNEASGPPSSDNLSPRN
jgi:hypothetical protein